MISRFSVKKPLTIFVTVFMVLVLGFISFGNMIPDLLPSINLPYAVVITAYPGATPEEVESTVTRPLEQSMASLENINTLSSTSSDSVSQIVLEFNDSADMDVVVPEIREAINMISGEWPETVITPFIMKLNPDILPVVISAANYEGKSNVELTEFINDEVLSELEGVSGVASVDMDGDVQEQVNVLLSQAKIDALNRQISDSLLLEFSEAEAELSDAEQEVMDGLSEIDQNQTDLQSAREQLETGGGQLATQSTQAEAMLEGQQTELELGIVQMQAQIAASRASLAALEATHTTLSNLSAELKNLYTRRDTLTNNIAELTQIQADYPTFTAKVSELEAQIAPLAEKEAAGTLTAEETTRLATLRADLVLAQTDVQVADAKLAAQGTNYAGIDAKIAEYNTELSTLNTTISTAETAMQALSLADVNAIDAQIAMLAAETETLKAGIAQLEATLTQMEQGAITLSAGLAELSRQQLSGTLQISAGLAEIIAGQTALASAEAELEGAQEQMDTAREDLESEEENALRSATVEITMDMVNQILMAQNFSMPAGYITEDNVDYLIRVGDTVESIEELQNLPLMNIDMDGVGTVYLSDVADVFLTDNADLLYSKVNGENALILSFSKQPTYATATVSQNLNEKFSELSEEYEGLSFSNLMDQGDYIELVIDSVLESLIYGAALSILVLLLFLRDIRPTLIIAFSIPISLLFAMVLMYFSGVSLNIISLSGLAIGVGMLVDNSVVVIENIYRMRSRGESSFKAAARGAAQVTGAITASTLTTVMVFLPIVFIEGITRDLFTDMALTVGYSLMASLLVAITLVPALASKTLVKEKERNDVFFQKILNQYERIARIALKRKAMVLVLSLVLLFGSAFLILARGFIFMPTMSSTELTVSVPLEPNSPFEEDVALADELYSRLAEIPELKTVGITLPSEDGDAVGSLMSMSMSGVDQISVNVLMAEDAARSDAEISEEIVAIGQELGVEAEVTGASSMTSMFGASGVTVSVYGQDLDNLIEEAGRLYTELEAIDGLEDISDGLSDTSPEIRITVDKEKAVEHGLLTAQIFAEVAERIVAESDSTEIAIENNDTDIVLYSEENQKMTLEELENLVIEYEDMQGEHGEVALSSIATITETQSLNAVSRENQRRTITLSATVAEGYNITLITEEINTVLESYTPLPGNSIEVGGENDTIMDAMEQLVLMLLLAIVIIYCIMVAQFQSLKFPFIVMFTIPLAMTGGFLALLVTGLEISVVAMVGFVMLSGIIVNNGIVLIDYINILREGGMEKKEAIVLAGRTRMRPILMTALTTILGLVFMAVGTGVGTEMMQPIAIVCIGGLLYATLMTLFVVPVLYDLFSTKEIVVIDV